MKRREQALLLLRKAAQDESLLDAVLESDKVSDEVIGFHCQQAAEKMLKAVLSEPGVTFHKTNELGALMDSLARSGAPCRASLRISTFSRPLARCIVTTTTTAWSR